MYFIFHFVILLSTVTPSSFLIGTVSSLGFFPNQTSASNGLSSLSNTIYFTFHNIHSLPSSPFSLYTDRRYCFALPGFLFEYLRNPISLTVSASLSGSGIHSNPSSS